MSFELMRSGLDEVDSVFSDSSGTADSDNPDPEPFDAPGSTDDDPDFGDDDLSDDPDLHDPDDDDDLSGTADVPDDVI